MKEIAFIMCVNKSILKKYCQLYTVGIIHKNYRYILKISAKTN